MPVAHYIAHHEGTPIRVENTWFAGARLYINEELCDRTEAFLLPMERIVFQGRIGPGDEAPRVRVTCRSGIFEIPYRIFVDDTELPVFKQCA